MNQLDDPIPISALQHAVFCLRQAALIHVERLWTDNRLTAEGSVLHEAAHDPGREPGVPYGALPRFLSPAEGSISLASPISSNSAPVTTAVKLHSRSSTSAAK